jgi:hypothetical protein
MLLSNPALIISYNVMICQNGFVCKQGHGMPCPCFNVINVLGNVRGKPINYILQISLYAECRFDPIF